MNVNESRTNDLRPLWIPTENSQAMEAYSQMPSLQEANEMTNNTNDNSLRKQAEELVQILLECGSLENQAAHMDCTVTGSNHIEQVLQSAEESGYKRGVEAAVKQCEVDWPNGYPAQKIEYTTTDILKQRILSLLKDETK